MIKIIKDIGVLEEIRELLRNGGEYAYVGPPSKCGTLLVKENDKWFHIYINESKKPVRLYKKKYSYEDAGSFSEGLAWVRKKGKEFHITPDGKPAYKEKYDWVGSFSNGVTRVRNNRKEFHIGTDGKPLYKERFDRVAVFRNGKTWVRINRSYVFNTNRTVQKNIKEKRFYIGLDGKRIK